MKPATITLADSGESFVVRPGETILRAGLAAGFAMPYECASGSCGSCKVRLQEGEVDMIWPEAPGLTERDRKQGRARPLLPGSAAHGLHGAGAPWPRPRWRSPRRRASRPPARCWSSSPGACSSSAAGQQCPVPFLPGQYVLLQVPGGQRRAYSMANTEPETLDFIVKEKPGGHASRYLFEDLAVGDTLEPGGALRPGLPAHAAGARHRLRRRRLRARADSLRGAGCAGPARHACRPALLRREQCGRALHGGRDGGAGGRGTSASRSRSRCATGRRVTPPASSAMSRWRRWRNSTRATSTWPGHRG